MKKAISFALALLMMISVIPICASAAEVTNITTIAQLAAINDNLSGNYILMENLDLSDYGNWTPIGASSAFSGTFEGNGKKITGLTVNVSGTGSNVYAGLFGYVTGSVKNISVAGTVTATANTTSSSSVYAGGVVGNLGGWFSSLEGCTSTCTVTATLTCNSSSSFLTPTGKAYAGGIVGSSSSWAEIYECAHTSGKVSATANMTNKGNSESYAGGIAGKASGTILDTYNTTEISAIASKSSGSTAVAYAGGIAGSGTSFKTSYNTGKVTGSGTTANIGAVAGSLSGTSTNCYYLSSAATKAYGTYTGSAETVPTAKAMSSAYNMSGTKCTGFDFDSVWSSSLLTAPTLYPRDKVITGEVTVTGTYEYGASLAANVSSVSPAEAQENLKYQWYRGTKDADGNIAYVAIDNATGKSYTLAKDDIGKYVLLKVKGKYIKLLKYGYAGSLSSDGKLVSKKTPGTPAAPTAQKIGDTSLTLNTVEGAQYGVATAKTGWFSSGWNTPTWQDSNVFTGLTPETKYGFYVKIPESETTNASDVSAVAEITTYAEGYDPYAISGTVTISGTAASGQKLTAVTSGITAAQSGTIGYTYKWNRDGAAISGATASTYTLTTADIGSAITVTVTAKSPYTGSLTSAATTIALAKPAVTALSNTETGVKITWNAVAGATSYNIYKYSTGLFASWKSIGTATATSYIDTSAESGKECKYTVEAVKGTATSGYDSTGKSITFLAVPSVNSAVKSATGVTVTWGSVSGATSYNVYRKTGTGSYTSIAKDVTGTSYTDTTAATGNKYTYTVAAVASGSSSTSAYSAAGKDVIILKAPAIKSVTATATAAAVTWESSTLATSYTVYRKTDSADWSVLKSGITTTSYNDTAVVNGTRYYYSVEAVNGAFTSGYDTTGTAFKFVPLHTHTYDAWIIDTAPTCTTAGTQHKICTICENRVNGTIAALGHNYSADWTVDTPATCTAAGSKSHHCTRCDAKSNITTIAAKGHSFGAWSIDTDSTCTSVGSQHRICTICNFTQTEAIAKKAHTYGEWQITKESTCAEEGSRHRFCTICNNEQTEVIAKKAHTYGDWIIDREPTCTATGAQHKVCSACDNILSGTIKPLGHDFSTAWTVDKKATYTEKGSKSHHCTRCAAKSDVTAIAIVKLPAPKLVAIANTSAGVAVKWSKVAVATGYYVYRKAGTAASWSKIATITNASTVVYIDKTAKSGTYYAYTVRAYNAVQSGAFNNTGLKIKHLSMPKITLANAAKAVTVKWNKIAGATGYIVYRKAGSAKSWTKVATIGKNATITYTDANVRSGVNYTYTVKAYYGNVYSAFNTRGVAIKFIAPTVLNSAVSGKTGITLKYSKVAAGTGYVIYRKTGSGSYSKLATVSGNTKVTYLDKTAKKGVTYTYIVRAYNGKFMSANSNARACKDKY